MYVQNLKFVALPVPGIIRGTQNFLGESLAMPTLSIPKKNRIGLPYRLFSAIWIRVLGGVVNPQSWGSGGRRGREWYRSKERL